MRLTPAGHRAIEVSAFVSPKWVPQMGDAAEVFAGITQAARRALQRARAQSRRARSRACRRRPRSRHLRRRVRDVQPPQHQPVDRRVVRDLSRRSPTRRSQAGLRVRAYLSTSFGCPFEGAVPISRVVELTERLLQLGAYEVAVSDTIGIAHPGQVSRRARGAARRGSASIGSRCTFTTRAARRSPTSSRRCSTASRRSTASAGGLGGCPYAPGAAGNLATEDLIYMLDGLGIETGVSLARCRGSVAAIEAGRSATRCRRATCRPQRGFAALRSAISRSMIWR